MARELDIIIAADTAQAEQALARVEQGLQSIEKAAPPVSESMDDLMGPDVRAKFREMRESLDRTEEGLKKLPPVADKGTQSLGALGEAVRRYAAPAAIGFAIKQTLAYADSLDDLSKQTGIAPGKLQALEFSAKQFGIALDPLAKSISIMSDRIASGDKSAVASIDRLGLSFKNIKGMSPDAAFLSIAKAVAEVEDPMQRAAIATDIFGKGGHALLPLLTSDIDELTKKAHALGLVFDDETTKAAARLNDEFDNLLSVGKRLIMVFFAPLLPILNTLITPIQFLTAELGKMINTILSPLAQMREFAEVLGIIQMRTSAMPGVPRGPGATFLPGTLPALSGNPDISGMFPSGAGGGARRVASNVLPFVRPELMGERDIFSIAGRGPIGGFGGGFPGWAPLPPLVSTGSLPWAPYAGTVPMNAPGVGGPGFMAGAGGRFLGAGLGMATNFMPGLSQPGAGIGSGVGGALGGLKSVTGMLGSFAPFLGPIMGIAGGLIGKLFGPSEGDRTRDKRSEFVGEFGGMDALKDAAERAGFSLDRLLSTKKIAEFDTEVQKLAEAMGAFERKVADANAELSNLQGELDATIRHGKDLGYTFDAEGNLVSVSFEKMQEAAQRYGVDLESLGPAFQRQRLHEAASTIINDFQLLTLGGADVGAVLFGMQDEISALVNDSLKFGIDIPANMKPWIEELLRAGLLTDENGNKMEDLSGLKFADPIVTEFEKITKKLDELIDKIADMISRIDEMTRPRTINIGWNVEQPPDIPGGPDYNSQGGFVGMPRYLSGGGWLPRGTDTVPAMLTPGEGVMRRDAVSRLMRGDWPQGGGGLQLSIGNISIDSGARSEAEYENQIGKAVVKGLKRRGVRLNAA